MNKRIHFQIRHHLLLIWNKNQIYARVNKVLCDLEQSMKNMVLEYTSVYSEYIYT